MSLNASTIAVLIEKGLSAADILDVARATEVKADPTNAERQARHRAKRKSNAVTVTDAPLNEDTSKPISSEPEGSSDRVVARGRDAFPPPEGVPAETWTDFLNSPKRRKAGMNATAYRGIKSNLGALAEHGFPPGKMIALAVERGWVTVKLEWVLGDGQQANRRDHRNGAGAGMGGARTDPLLELHRAAVSAAGRGACDPH